MFVKLIRRAIPLSVALVLACAGWAVACVNPTPTCVQPTKQNVVYTYTDPITVGAQTTVTAHTVNNQPLCADFVGSLASWKYDKANSKYPQSLYEVAPVFIAKGQHSTTASVDNVCGQRDAYAGTGPGKGDTLGTGNGDYNEVFINTIATGPTPYSANPPGSCTPVTPPPNNPTPTPSNPTPQATPGPFSLTHISRCTGYTRFNPNNAANGSVHRLTIHPAGHPVWSRLLGPGYNHPVVYKHLAPNTLVKYWIDGVKHQFRTPGACAVPHSGLRTAHSVARSVSLRQVVYHPLLAA